MEYRMPKSTAVAILMLVIVALVPVIVYFVGMVNIFIYITSAVIGWSVMILLAVIGAFFLGMLVSYRMIMKNEFTPFEEEMLKMRKEVQDIKKVLEDMKKT